MEGSPRMEESSNEQEKGLEIRRADIIDHIRYFKAQFEQLEKVASTADADTLDDIGDGIGQIYKGAREGVDWGIDWGRALPPNYPHIKE